MAGLDSIKARIEADCAAECERIASQAGERAARIAADSDAEIAAMRGELAARAEAACAQKKRIAESAVSLDARKKLLAEKQKLIARVYSGAVERLESAPDGEYCEALMLMFGQSGAKAGQTVRFAAGRNGLDRRLLDMMNAKLGGGKLLLGEPAEGLGGGFILCGENSREICSFEAAVRLRREELEPEVAKILFG